MTHGTFSEALITTTGSCHVFNPSPMYGWRQATMLILVHLSGSCTRMSIQFGANVSHHYARHRPHQSSGAFSCCTTTHIVYGHVSAVRLHCSGPLHTGHDPKGDSKGFLLQGQRASNTMVLPTFTLYHARVLAPAACSTQHQQPATKAPCVRCWGSIGLGVAA
jgi:hypothetical protein